MLTHTYEPSLQVWPGPFPDFWEGPGDEANVCVCVLGGRGGELHVCVCMGGTVTTKLITILDMLKTKQWSLGEYPFWLFVGTSSSLRALAASPSFSSWQLISSFSSIFTLEPLNMLLHMLISFLLWFVFVLHGISDLVDGLIRLMNSNFSQPVNLGNPEEHTILDFAKLVQKYSGMC